MASEEWRPAGPAVCRCCFAEGCYKDISSEYFWMGKKEVYADMLNETFNINISHSKWSGPSSTSRLICEACIARLRDAAEFKKQVVECEKTFMQHLDPTTSSLQPEVECEVPAAEVKLEGVKVEKLLEDEDDFDNRMGFDDDDEDMDQPLVSLASKVPKKEQINVLDLLKGTEVVVKKKKSVMRAKEPLQKVKVKKVVRPAPPPKPDKAVPKKKVSREVMAKRNAHVVLQHTTLYPFRIQTHTIICAYCTQEFEDPQVFKEHVDEAHAVVGNVARAFGHITGKTDFLKVECSNIQCKLCSERFQTLEKMAEHLAGKHGNRLINLKYEVGLRPFILDKKNWRCYVCKIKMPSLVKLYRHQSSHYTQYTCDSCGRSYLTNESLAYHIKYTHRQTAGFVCRKCKKSFPTAELKKEHLATSKSCWVYCCIYCGERFTSWELKQRHLTEAHGTPKRTYDCPDCEMVFKTRKHFYTHFKLNHTDEGFACMCGQKFVVKRHLEEHKLVHTGEKKHNCSVCEKGFSTYKSLRQHMWIHSEVKRFSCKECSKQFAQKVCWKNHMKTHHSVVVD